MILCSTYITDTKIGYVILKSSYVLLFKPILPGKKTAHSYSIKLLKKQNYKTMDYCLFIHHQTKCICMSRSFGLLVLKYRHALVCLRGDYSLQN